MLQLVDKDGRTQLLRHLVIIDMAFRQTLGNPVDFSIYSTRFPNDAPLISELRAEFEQENLPAGNSAARAQIEESGQPISPVGYDVKTVTFHRQLNDGIGNYQLLKRIGRGGGGEVYVARHRSLERLDAVKLLAAKDAGDAQVRQRFYREMQSIGRLKHPHIVQAYDAGESDGVLYLAMELVEGPDVEKLAKRIMRMEVADACEIVRQAALGLHHIFEHGLVHRDLKPSNLLISPSGVKIADLGMALLRTSELSDQRLTGTFVILGTADYMAPEQAENARGADIRADLYSLGCTLYRLLAGHVPFAHIGRGMVLQKLQAHVHDPAPDIRTRRVDIPEPLVGILNKLLAKDRESRFAEPRELASALL